MLGVSLRRYKTLAVTPGVKCTQGAPGVLNATLQRRLICVGWHKQQCDSFISDSGVHTGLISIPGHFAVQGRVCCVELSQVYWEWHGKDQLSWAFIWCKRWPQLTVYNIKYSGKYLYLGRSSSNMKILGSCG